MSSIPSLSTEPETATASFESQSLDTAGNSVKPGDPAGQNSLYRVIWRWHFYAGLLVAPFLFLVSATGAIHVFKNEVSAWLYRDLYFVTPTGPMLSYDEQFQALERQADNLHEVEGLNLQNNPNRSTQFMAHALPGDDTTPGQMHRMFFLDPYSGKLLGSQILEREFFGVVLDLHRTLCGGVTGRVFVELATCWSIVLVLTGIYLWWPRGKQRSAGVWYPRMKAKLYVLLRDWHVVIGFYSAALSIIVLWTGLFVSVLWGTGFTLASMQMNQSLLDFFTPAQSPSIPESPPPRSLNAVAVTALSKSQPNDNVFIQLSEKPEQTHKVYLMQDGDTNTVRSLDIDQYTGALLASTNTDELTPMVRLLALAVSLHQGKTFGLPSKIAALLTCIVLMWMAVSGVWMWWDRRPRGKTGFPRKPQAGLGTGIWVIVVLVCLIFPVVGVSAILFLIVDFVVGKLRRKAAVA